MGTGLEFVAIGSSLFQAGTSYMSAKEQAHALKLQGEYIKEVSKTNTMFAQAKAEDAIRRGEMEANEQRKQVKRVIGSQRAALAAQGIDIESGSALQIQADTRMLGELDAITVKNNAWREAFGYKMEAQEATRQGRIASLSAQSNARNTMLTGGLNAIGYGAQAIGSYYKFRGNS